MTNSTKSFNETNFSNLLAWHVQNYSSCSLESVLTVLCQSSDNSRLGKLNHNCRISGIPFTWNYRSGDKEIRVLTFPMTKISTGWDFYLDIEESGDLYISEGKGTRRTHCKSSILNDFAPSTMHQIADVIDLLCGHEMTTEQIFFDIYRRFGGTGDLSYSKFDNETKSLYNLYAFNSDYKYLEYMQKFKSANEYEEIQKTNIPTIVVIRWDSEDNCWYGDFLVENSAWHIDCLNDVGSYPVKEDFTFDGDESTPKYAQDWLVKAIKAIPYGDWKTGSYFCYESDNGEWKSTRIWSKIPENKQINLFISTDKDCRYFYNDIREIDLSSEDNPTSDICMRFGNGRVIFTFDHECCESRDNGCIGNQFAEIDMESVCNKPYESIEDD